MGSVTVYSKTKTDALLAPTVVDAAIIDNHLILSHQNGSTEDLGSVLAGLPDATTALKGAVELATDVETVAGTDTVRAVTPFGLAAVVSSTTARGLVELATNAETLAGTDTARAVTPAALASLPAVKLTTGNAETDDPSAYPTGISLLTLTSSSWSLNSGNGTVVTIKAATNNTVQNFYTVNGPAGYPRAWTRQYNAGWTPWEEFVILNTLTAASFTQSTAFTSYPEGTSRLYYTTVNSSSWDFAGKAGEVITYRNGTDFARQTWIQHLGGTSANTETWVRTATAAGGWTNWLVVAEDTGWVSLGTLTTGYTAQVACTVRRRNGIVYMRGAFQAPAGGYTSTGLVIPPAYRPSANIAFPITANTTVTMSCSITSAGAIQTWLSSSSTASFHLDGISYPLG